MPDRAERESRSASAGFVKVWARRAGGRVVQEWRKQSRGRAIGLDLDPPPPCRPVELQVLVVPSRMALKWLAPIVVTLAGAAISIASCSSEVRAPGASAGTTGTTGSGGSGGIGCPEAEPEAYSPCSAGPVECHYSCCGNSYQCQGDTWIPSSADCPYPCPLEAPAAGEPCCHGTCVYDSCSGQGSSIVATCEDELWQVETEPCTPCGDAGLACPSGELCVAFESFAVEYECESYNPCGEGPLGCDCAAPLCGAFACTSAEGSTVTCSCLDC
jgi:hypothetical protein